MVYFKKGGHLTHPPDSKNHVVAVKYASFLTFNDAIRVVELGPYRYAGDVDCERTRCVVGVLHGCLDIDRLRASCSKEIILSLKQM